ncbi:invasion protein IalB [Methylobacterium sp. BE186]|uniref:invasion associated locus B family protein n=1 Tax=Methylobacterium sp. BE186 TaxID=2817715 RepID=UPI00285F719C|nr:invasion associated locus B family protein [Methylobacterium sp. BE186]MDR7040123.1 invasion protein IalB [Methylobacterium sp. BE186]
MRRARIDRWKHQHSLAALLLGTVLLAGPAAAQQGGAAKAAPQPAAPAVPTEPGLTTATFGDWVLRCQRTAEAEKSRKVCEIAQSMQVQGQSAPIAQVAIGRVAPGDPLTMTAILPNNVSFPSSVRATLDEKDSQGFDLPWRRCLPGRCVADATVRDDTLKRWRSAPEAGRITFKDAGNHDVAIPLSFRGLAQALDALARE